MRYGNTRDRSPGTASFKVGIRLLRHHDPASAEHIGELGNVFTVLDGLVKGAGEVFAYQKGKIGIVCLIFL